MTETEQPAPAGPDDRSGLMQRASLATLATILVVAAVLHFGRSVFLPLSIATLIAFALSPAVSILRRHGLPRVVAVLAAVTVAFAILGVVLAIMAGQLSMVLDRMPTFQSNIISKLEGLKDAQDSSGVVGRFVEMLGRINDEISTAVPEGSEVATGLTGGTAPVEVAVVEDRSVWRVLLDIVLPIISPVVTGGLVIVVVVFMVMEREDLRDRFIRLVGSNDLHRTTEMLEDAGSRVARYLQIMLLVNTIYAVPIGLGLWAIGVPNPLLWALMTLVLRFVPYVGTFISAAIPLFLAFAVSPDWSMVLWVAALFMAVELVTSNFVEPQLYGSRTGLSPLAVIVAAIIWTWIWGPMGQILSTPLTVCLVVLGRYLPQFELFDVLFGDEPVLDAHSWLYQRLLTGEVVEAASRAEEALETVYLADYYQQVCIPALLLAQTDYDRGVLSLGQEDRIALSASRMITALEPVAAEERDEGHAEAGSADAPEGGAMRVLVAGGRSKLDDVAARMLGQALTAEGAEVIPLARADLMGKPVLDVGGTAPDCLVLNFLDPDPPRAFLLILRRIKRAMPGLRVGVVIWQMPDIGPLHLGAGAKGSASAVARQSRVPAVATALHEAESIGADFVATTMEEAMKLAFAKASPKPLAPVQSRPPRKAVRRQVDPVAG